MNSKTKDKHQENTSCSARSRHRAKTIRTAKVKALCVTLGCVEKVLLEGTHLCLPCWMNEPQEVGWDVKRVMDIPVVCRKRQAWTCGGSDPCSRILDEGGERRQPRVVDLRLLALNMYKALVCYPLKRLLFPFLMFLFLFMAPRWSPKFVALALHYLFTPFPSLYPAVIQTFVFYFPSPGSLLPSQLDSTCPCSRHSGLFYILLSYPSSWHLSCFKTTGSSSLSIYLKTPQISIPALCLCVPMKQVKQTTGSCRSFLPPSRFPSYCSLFLDGHPSFLPTAFLLGLEDGPQSSPPSWRLQSRTQIKFHLWWKSPWYHLSHREHLPHSALN